MTAITEKLGTNSWGMYFDPAKFDFETFKSHWDYDISMIKQMPMDWLRIGYTYYDSGLNTDGSYNFERLDYAINTAQSSGLKIILPIWFVDDGLTNKTNIDYQSYYAKWIDMIEKIVQRYAGKGIYYEAIDEATSGGHFWLNQNITDSILNDIVSMNKKFYTFVRKYDDSARFINGDFASPGSNTNSVIDKGMLEFGDYVSYHPYFANPEDMINNSSQIDLRNKIFNTGLPISATEFGFGVPSAFNGANTREQQASKLLRQIFILDMLGFEHIVQFTMDGSDKVWVLQNEDGTFNLSGQLIKSKISELHGYTFKERINSDDNDYLLHYVKNGYPDKVVYWTTSSDHEYEKYQLTDTPKIDTLNYTTTYENTKLWKIGDEVTTETLNNIENAVYNIANDVNDLQKQTTEKAQRRVPLLNGDNVFTQKNTFKNAINGGLLSRIATFTDFNTVFQNMDAYVGLWKVDNFTVANSPVADMKYYQVEVQAGDWYKSGVVNIYDRINDVYYYTTVSNSVSKGWKKISRDDLVVHNTGTETISGDKTFTGSVKFSGDVNIVSATTRGQIQNGADLNNYTDTYKYVVSGANSLVNYPNSANNYATLEVEKVNQSTITQKITDVARRVFIRSLGGIPAKWTDWTELANDAKVVHNTGNESIAGNKVFTGTIDAAQKVYTRTIGSTTDTLQIIYTRVGNVVTGRVIAKASGTFTLAGNDGYKSTSGYKVNVIALNVDAFFTTDNKFTANTAGEGNFMFITSDPLPAN